MLYWQIGRGIVQRQEFDGWGAKVIDRLSADLRQAFPDMKGFSARNLKYMRAFAVAWPDESFVQEVLAQITWYHNIALVEKLSDPEVRRWYARAAIEFGWSRNVLALQIDSALHRRQGQATTNFARTLPEPRSELAQNLLKDPYNFDFLMLNAAPTNVTSSAVFCTISKTSCSNLASVLPFSAANIISKSARRISSSICSSIM